MDNNYENTFVEETTENTAVDVVYESNEVSVEPSEDSSIGETLIKVGIAAGSAAAGYVIGKYGKPMWEKGKVKFAEHKVKSAEKKAEKAAKKAEKKAAKEAKKKGVIESDATEIE